MLRKEGVGASCFHARLPERFDLVLHLDETRAVEQIERNPLWVPGRWQRTTTGAYSAWTAEIP